MLTAKEQVQRFVNELPEDSSLDDIEQKIIQEIRYEKHVLKMIEQGRKDVAEGRTYSHAEVGRMLGLKP